MQRYKKLLDTQYTLPPILDLDIHCGHFKFEDHYFISQSQLFLIKAMPSE